MLDIITVFSSSFKRVRYCKLWELIISSDHAGIICKLSITSIKYSGTSKILILAGTIEWKTRAKDDIMRQRFNKRLKELNGEGLTPHSTSWRI